jgi:methylated-DNA-[protein]-cysteine S-methyltransferase
MIHVYHQRLGDFWYAAAVEDDKVWVTSFGSDEKGVLQSVLEGIPFKVPFQVAEGQSQLSEKVLGAMKSMVVGEDVSPSDFRFDMTRLPQYSKRVLVFLSRVPVGYVTTYGALAKVAGGGPRAVGNVMASNPFAPLIPCHRVVRSDFSLGGYGGNVFGEGVKTKLAILQREDRGFKDPSKIRVNGSVLSVFPVGFVRKD